eukprot:359365-Chlamydomonas_euryale.AAC.16
MGEESGAADGCDGQHRSTDIPYPQAASLLDGYRCALQPDVGCRGGVEVGASAPQRGQQSHLRGVQDVRVRGALDLLVACGRAGGWGRRGR